MSGATPFTDEWTECGVELRAHLGEVTPGRPFLYGQSARFVGGISSAADVVQRISTAAEQILDDRLRVLLRGAD